MLPPIHPPKSYQIRYDLVWFGAFSLKSCQIISNLIWFGPIWYESKVIKVIKVLKVIKVWPPPGGGGQTFNLGRWVGCKFDMICMIWGRCAPNHTNHTKFGIIYMIWGTPAPNHTNHIKFAYESKVIKVIKVLKVIKVWPPPGGERPNF